MNDLPHSVVEALLNQKEQWLRSLGVTEENVRVFANTWEVESSEPIFINAPNDTVIVRQELRLTLRNEP